eukprot:symbB.v1.2.016171.t4/scaffold1226.1/size132380/7
MGYITPELTGKFPGFLSPSAGLKFADVPNGLAAISKVPAGGWAQIAAYMAFCEVSQDQSPGTAAFAGDFGWKLITSDDPEVKKTKLNAELANGRLAMMAIIGMFFQDGLTGSAWGDWANYTASPLRAFENEPGFLSPSAGLKFADIPNGLAAVSKVPVAGWAQIAAYFGFVEFSGGFDDYKTGTPGDYGFKVLTSSDPEEKTKKLSAELANGRLAMMAIIGMFFQDGLTGSAWGDWANYTASPLRAFENEPGFLSPSAGLKFADIPNGLAAVSKVPVAGWAQIAAYFGFVEFSGGFDDYKTGTPGDYGFKVLTSSDPEEKTKKLSAELANGRLAMMAIIGMFFQAFACGALCSVGGCLDWFRAKANPRAMSYVRERTAAAIEEAIGTQLTRQVDEEAAQRKAQELRI